MAVTTMALTATTGDHQRACWGEAVATTDRARRTVSEAVRMKRRNMGRDRMSSKIRYRTFWMAFLAESSFVFMTLLRSANLRFSSCIFCWSDATSETIAAVEGVTVPSC